VSYNVGDAVPLGIEVHNPTTGALTSATVSITLTKPDGTAATTPDITNPSTGIYRASPTVDALGLWTGVWTTSGTVVTVTPFSFYVGAAVTTEYTTPAVVKGMIGKTTDDDRDDLIIQAIAAASRMIDQRCGRRFYADATATARTFTAHDRLLTVGDTQSLRVDDYLASAGATVETKTSFTGTWTTVTGWEPGPDNADAAGMPWTEIAYQAGWAGDTTKVRVTARWGWPAIPDAVAQAAALLAARLYQSKDSPNGVLGSADWGAIRVSRFDPDVEVLIAPYILIFA
jgi:hypothetical protein